MSAVRGGVVIVAILGGEGMARGVDLQGRVVVQVCLVVERAVLVQARIGHIEAEATVGARGPTGIGSTVNPCRCRR